MAFQFRHLDLVNGDQLHHPLGSLNVPGSTGAVGSMWGGLLCLVGYCARDHGNCFKESWVVAGHFEKQKVLKWNC